MSNLLTGKPQLSRFINRRLILDKIRRDGEISRAELAKQTSIRPPTVSAIIKELVDEGLVEEVGSGETNGGRAPRMISLSRRQPQALGFEINETGIVAGVCDISGQVYADRDVQFSPLPPEEAVEMLFEIGSDLLREVNVEWKQLKGVGVAVPGHLNVSEGVVRWSSPFQWRDVPFKRMCEKRWGVQTDVVNDSLAGGMAACLFDTAQSVDNLVFMYIRFRDISHGVLGLGSGIIINGQPYHGEFGAAGEITTPVKHPIFHVRERGSGSFDSIDDFVQSIKRADAPALQAMEAVGLDLSTLVVHVVNLLEPGVLMIGSDIPILRDILLNQWHEVLEKHSLAYEAGKTQLMASCLGKHGVLKGAIVPTLQRVFRLPQWH